MFCVGRFKKAINDEMEYASPVLSNNGASDTGYKTFDYMKIDLWACR